ncbi:tripartite motif-containing protein 16 [Denticeps clupeoides]|uniref:Tripartite motif-containing protein 16 n=1 Tax=Denticeps clupeoides TaxID=299321 RepID=A0AAY3ZUA1_9TELE|nr:tripartite motif-containing protein 16 [Denticeps clupeoides]
MADTQTVPLRPGSLKSDCPQRHEKIDGKTRTKSESRVRFNGVAGKEETPMMEHKVAWESTPVPEQKAQDAKPAADPKVQPGLKEPQEPQKAQEDVKKESDPQSPEEEKVKELPVEEPLGPDDVVCDSCIESPRRAAKSCLTCMVSYCGSHLRPHRENPKFQNHRLVEPLKDLEKRTCESHKWPLELYCGADACCVCQDCLKEDHRGHSAVPVTEARSKIEKELREKQAEMARTTSAAENAIGKLQANTVTIETSVKDVQAVIEEQFTKLRSAVEKTKKEVTEILEGEQKQALKQAEGIQVHLKQRCTDLKKMQTQVEKLSKMQNDVDFLQNYSEWKKEKPDVSLPGVYIGLMDRLNKFSRVITESTQEMCDHLLSTNYKLKETCRSDKVGIKTTVHAIASAKHIASMPDPKTREDFLKYATSLSLDGNTAHKFLRLTEDNRKATNTTPWQHSYPDVPERFEHWRQVLAMESFYLGRHYFEVDLSGDGTHVGVTYKSIDRKGSESNSCITGNNFSWCLQWNGRHFSTWHSDVETPLKVDKATRVGVYVDFDCGRLAFYAAGESMPLIHEYKADFLEPVYPAFWLSKKENVAVLVAPGDALPLKSPSPPLSPPTKPAAPPSLP